MKGFEDIQQLWQGQKPEPNVSFETILKRLKHDRNALAGKLLWQSIAVGITILAILWITIRVDFSTWTTYLALAITMGCIAYYFGNQLRDYKRISRCSQLLSKPQDYIDHLRAFQQERNRFNTRNYVMYEICIAAAFALYGIEMYFMLPLLTLVGIFVFVIFWFLICHFVFMKQYIKSENTRIEEMIDNLKRIKRQFE